MFSVVATTADWPIIGDIARLLGALLNLLYNGMSNIGIDNVGVSIIVFTVIIFTLMLPLTIKQQRGMRIQQVMQPEIQKIQKKYAGKRDQTTMMKQQEEMRLLQQKYGASPFSSCLPLLATMPILFALFPVVQNIPRYVEGVRRVYSPLVERLINYPGSDQLLQVVGEDLPFGLGDYDFTQANNVYTLLARLQEQNWQALIETFPTLSYVITNTREELYQINAFLGISISENPINMLTSSFSAGNFAGVALATVIPVFAGLTQFLSVKLQPQPAGDPDNPIARQMRTMIYFMPLISVFFGFTLPAGLGLYWGVSAVVRTIQQIFINRSLNKKGTEALIEENLKKSEKRQARKKTTSAQTINSMATKATRNIDESKSDSDSNTKTTSSSYSGGSLSAKANMVSRYNAGKETNEETKGKDGKNKGKEVADEK
jgi:YidC/Oxa1 family membrane protein insertase